MSHSRKEREGREGESGNGDSIEVLVHTPDEEWHEHGVDHS